MERRGGCCIARYGGNADVAWRVGRIMLKYRPIAPKPAAMAATTPATADLKSAPASFSGRLKRKAGPSGTDAAKRPAGKRGRKPKKANTTPPHTQTQTQTQTEDREEKCSSSSSTTTTTSVDSSSFVTLSLMPESPEVKLVSSADQTNKRVAAVVAPTPVRAVGSWVTVEGLTDIWREEVPVLPGLASDELPVFVSDGWGRVTWANEAYKNLVTGGGGEEEEEEEVRVGLVSRGLVPAWGTCCGFTCRVRVGYACRRKGKVSLAAPCDVWRVDGGGYVWRLDTKAALSLGIIGL